MITPHPSPMFLNFQRAVTEKRLLFDSHIIQYKYFLKVGCSDAYDKTTYAYANLEVIGQKKTLKKANLNCIQIKINSFESKKLYIDSVAYVLSDGYQAKENKINVKVYWLFNVKIEEKDIDKFRIFIRPNEEKNCFDYGI